MQLVSSNNVRSCWPKKLSPFKRGLWLGKGEEKHRITALNIQKTPLRLSHNCLYCSGVRILQGYQYCAQKKKWKYYFKACFTWWWGTPGRWGNPLRWGNPPVQQLSTLLDVAFCVCFHTLLHVLACCWELSRKVWKRSNVQLLHANRRIKCQHYWANNVGSCWVRLHVALYLCWEFWRPFADNCQHARNKSQLCQANNVGSCWVRLHVALYLCDKMSWNLFEHKFLLKILSSRQRLPSPVIQSFTCISLNTNSF